MYAAQHAPAASARGYPPTSSSAQGRVSAPEMSTTPSRRAGDGDGVHAAGATARSASTSGPMNSIVTATPIGSRASEL